MYASENNTWKTIQHISAKKAPIKISLGKNWEARTKKKIGFVPQNISAFVHCSFFVFAGSKNPTSSNTAYAKNIPIPKYKNLREEASVKKISWLNAKIPKIIIISPIIVMLEDIEFIDLDSFGEIFFNSNARKNGIKISFATFTKIWNIEKVPSNGRIGENSVNKKGKARDVITTNPVAQAVSKLNNLLIPGFVIPDGNAKNNKNAYR